MCNPIIACAACTGGILTTAIATPPLLLAAAFSMDSPHSTALFPLGILGVGLPIAYMTGVAGGALVAKITQVSLRALLKDD